MDDMPLADIGQFFRYDEQFPQHQKEAFARAYTEQSGYPLPADWVVLGQLRDLVNLLQMIDTDDELPGKFNDVLGLIRNSVSRIEAGSH